MTIIKVGNKWRLVSKKKRKNLGTFPSKSAAENHEGQVEYFKQHDFDFEPSIVTISSPQEKGTKDTDFANPNCPTCGKFTKYYLSSKHGRVLGCKSCNKTYKHKGEDNKPKEELGTAKVNEAKSEKVEGTTKVGLEASPKKDFSSDEVPLHPNLVEYAVRELFKKKPLDRVVKAVAKKFDKTNNIFLGGDVSVTPDSLKRAVLDRVAKNTIEGAKKMKEGFGHFSLSGNADQFNIEPRVLAQHIAQHPGYDKSSGILKEFPDVETPIKDFSGYTPGSLFKMPKYQDPFKLSKIVGQKAYLSHPKLGPASVSIANLGKMSQINPAPIPALTPPKESATKGLGIPSLNMQSYDADFERSLRMDVNDADFTEDIGDVLEHYPRDSTPAVRKVERTKATAKYDSDPIFKGNVDKISKHMAAMTAHAKDPESEFWSTHGLPAIHDSVENLHRLAEGHSAAVKHAYSLAHPDEMEGKVGYPGTAVEAARRYAENLHNHIYMSQKPQKDAPKEKDIATLPPSVRQSGPDKENLGKNIDRIRDFEKLRERPFMWSLLKNLENSHPNDIRSGDHELGPTPYAERLGKLKGGSLDKGKLDRLLTKMHEPYGSVTADQLHNHVLPNIDFKIPSDNRKDNMNPMYGEITPKIKDAILKSHKLAQQTGAKGIAEQREENAKLRQEMNDKGKIPTNSRTKEPFEGFDPLVKAKVSAKLAPHNRYETDGAIYSPLGANVVGLPGKGNKAYVTLEKRSGNPQAVNKIHVPWDKIEEFIKSHHVAHAPVA